MNFSLLHRLRRNATVLLVVASSTQLHAQSGGEILVSDAARAIHRCCPGR